MRSILVLSTSAVAVVAASTAFAGTVKYYADYDPAPLAAMEEIIADFEAANPEIDIQLQNFDHEGYKTSIRNFLTADAPDLANWYAGNRMAPFVNAGQFADISDVWEANGLKDSLASALPSMTIDEKQWGIPYTYYQWGIYYNKDAYAKVGAEVPETYEQFVANCALFKDAGIDCLTTGTKALWPGAGIFDYMNLRTNGYEFHMDLANGKVPWTDDRVRATFAEWAKLVEPGYISANHAALDWQDAASQLVQGTAANYVMGNFAVAVFKEGGMTNDTLGFMPFPTINPDVVRAEEAPTDTIHLTAAASNVEDAKAFLAYMAGAEAQTKMNAAMG
ncbi:MAG: extracellular solute-binding protein, partial [Verrucomicrobiae bacterium]|nr:extracellular solute-binding protein [Verrucomicrobiae bacterium]